MLTSYILIKRPTFSWLHMIFLNQSIKCGDSRLVIFQQCSSQVGCRRDISLLQTVPDVVTVHYLSNVSVHFTTILCRRS